MIPLRRLLIVEAHEELPYPEGTACAEVLRATAEGATGSHWIFWGMALGAGVKLLVSLAFLLPSQMSATLPVLPRAELALELAPALLGVGFILGYRQSAVCVAGALVSALVLIPLIAGTGAGLPAPLYPETQRLVAEMGAADLWSRYVRYVGAGAVATAGILTVLRGLPTMVGAFLAVARGLRRGGASGRGPAPASERDLPAGFILGGIVLVVGVAGLVPGVFAGGMGPVPRAVCAAGVGVFGVLFVAVAARIARRRPYRRHDRRGGGLESRRHLAGPQDRISGRRDPRSPASRSAHRGRLCLLGGGGHGHAAGHGLHLRL